MASQLTRRRVINKKRKRVTRRRKTISRRRKHKRRKTGHGVGASRPPDLYPFHGYIYNRSGCKKRTKKLTKGNDKDESTRHRVINRDGTPTGGILNQHGSRKWKQRGVFNRMMNALFPKKEKPVSGKKVRFDENAQKQNYTM